MVSIHSLACININLYNNNNNLLIHIFSDPTNVLNYSQSLLLIFFINILNVWYGYFYIFQHNHKGALLRHFAKKKGINLQAFN